MTRTPLASPSSDGSSATRNVNPYARRQYRAVPIPNTPTSPMQVQSVKVPCNDAGSRCTKVRLSAVNMTPRTAKAKEPTASFRYELITRSPQLQQEQPPAPSAVPTTPLAVDVAAPDVPAIQRCATCDANDPEYELAAMLAARTPAAAPPRALPAKEPTLKPQKHLSPIRVPWPIAFPRTPVAARKYA